MHKEVTEYYNKHGHLGVSRDDDSNLYYWMVAQRERYDGSRTLPLNDGQIEQLEQENFPWSPDWREWVWYEKYTEVVEFFKRHGHVSVKKKKLPSLYNWIQTQGQRYQGLEGHKPLSKEQIELL